MATKTQGANAAFQGHFKTLPSPRITRTASLLSHKKRKTQQDWIIFASWQYIRCWPLCNGYKNYCPCCEKTWAPRPETRWTPLQDASTDPKAISKIGRFRDLTPESSLGVGHIDSCRIVMAKLAASRQWASKRSLSLKQKDSENPKPIFLEGMRFLIPRKHSLGVNHS